MQLKKNAVNADRQISTNDTSQFSQIAKIRRSEGVKLTPQDKSYLLPHFLMLLVGKPGSGKTTMIKHLVMDREFYRGKFDNIMLISPSHSKIGLPLNASDTSSEFSLEWIYRNLDKVNKNQQSKLERIVSEDIRRTGEAPEDSTALLKAVTETNRGAGSLAHASSVLATKARDVAMFSGTTQRGNSDYAMMGLKQGGFANNFTMGRGRFGKTLRGETHLMKQLTHVVNQQGNNFNNHRRRTTKAFVKKTDLSRMPQGGYLESQSDQNFFGDFISRVSNLDKKVLALLTPEKIEQHHANVLIVLDDVIGPIKSMQNDPYLAQLFFNRRHLIANGTVSIIVVTQKYTMIPARIRSNASWLILFRLNPIDFDNVFQDAFTGSLRRWRELLTFVFGSEDQNMIDLEDQRKNKNFDNLGIWVETDTYFSNFQQIMLSDTVASKTEDLGQQFTQLEEQKS